MKTLRILAVDDHEMIMLGYKFILERIIFDDCNIIVITATSYEEGRKKIEESANTFCFDLLLLDVQLSPPNEDEIYNGEDLGVLARELVPETKIIFMSSFSDSFRINSILKSVDPDGYMIKSDIDPKTLEEAIKSVVKGQPYYSSKALSAIRKKMSNDITLDENDKKILFYLAKGTRTKDLENYVELSASSIENRKTSSKNQFLVPKKRTIWP